MLTMCKLVKMRLTPAHIKQTCELNNFHLLPFNVATQCCRPTIVAQFDVAKQPLNNIKVVGNPVFSRSTNLESKLIEFFVFVNV